MHEVGVAKMQSAVRHGHRHAAAVVAERLHVGRVRARITADNFGGRLVEEPDLRPAFDPQHRVRSGERVQLSARNLPAPDLAEPRRSFRRTALHQPARARKLRRRGIGGEQDGNAHLIGRRDILIQQPAVNLVLRTERARPPHKGQGFEIAQLHTGRARDEGVVGHVADQRHAALLQLRAPRRLHRPVELQNKQTRVRQRGILRQRLHGLLNFVRRLDAFVAQPDNLALGKSRSGPEEEGRDEK